MAEPARHLGGSLTAGIEVRDGTTWIALKGKITELVDFTPLTKLRGPLRFDLSGIERINSLGVRGWVDFVRTCEAAGLELTFERCSPVVVQQISMIANFMGLRSRVRSLHVPYLCPSCNAEDVKLVEVPDDAPLLVAPTMVCKTCQSGMQIDELETMYASLFEQD